MLTTCTIQIHPPFFSFHIYESYSTVYSSVQQITIMHFNSRCAYIYTIVVLLFFHLSYPIFYWDFMLPSCSFCLVDPVLWDNYSIPRNFLSATYYIQHVSVVTVCITMYICCFCVLYYYKFFVYFCVLFFLFCVFCSSTLTSCHATNVNQAFVLDLLAAKFLCNCSRFLQVTYSTK